MLADTSSKLIKRRSLPALGSPSVLCKTIILIRQRVCYGTSLPIAKPQGRLVRAVRGEIWDVAVDIRKRSPRFGRWIAIELSEENKRQLYVPAGFAHGFCVLSEVADVIYKCTNFYAPGDEYGVRWDDLTIGIDWPQTEHLLSEKDQAYPWLRDMDSALPVYHPA